MGERGGGEGCFQNPPLPKPFTRQAVLAKRNHHKKWQGLTPNAVQSRHRCRWSCCVLSLLSPVLLLSGWIVYPPGLRCTLSETRQLAHRGYASSVVLYCIIYTSYYQTMSHMVPAAIPSCFKSGKPATSQPVNQSTSQPVNQSTCVKMDQKLPT